MLNFNSSLSKILEFEGGYVNDPEDPGGETNLGISKRAYPQLEISTLTPQLVAPIYLKDYWEGAGCQNIPSPMNFLVFDCAVNQGVHAAQTIYSGNKTPTAFLTARLQRYKLSPNWGRYGTGWMNRLVLGLTFCLENI
jgi:hypothetical protein